MPFLVLRPLFLAAIEYALAIHVFRKGKFLTIAITYFLFFLATYQFGEFMFFTQNNNRYWLAISLASTTMLPPYGVLLIEKLSGRRAYPTFLFIVAIIFAGTYLLVPTVIPAASECNCFLKYDSSSLSGNNVNFYNAWRSYYMLSLTLSILAIAWDIVKKYGDTQNLKLLLIGYISFFPTSFLVVKLFGVDANIASSVMCTLGIFTAFIVSYISIYKEQGSEEIKSINHVNAK